MSDENGESTVDTMFFDIDEDEQAITFKHLPHDKQLADHEIIDRLFRKMHRSQIKSEIGWLRGKYEL